MLEGLITEQPNPASEHLDQLSTLDLLTVINREDQTIASAVAAEIPRIAQAVDAIVERYRRGGRLFYIGAGTSGRLGVLDAAECPPTFRSDPDSVRGVIAGGRKALWRSVEGAEDDPAAARAAIAELVVNHRDVVMGIATGGTTPYVHAALAEARRRRATTVFLACVPKSQVRIPCDIDIRVLTGPEVLAGSTRMKAGTATKLVLNLITTLSMVRIGKTYGNLMVDLNTYACRKLVDRAARVVASVTDLSYRDAERLLHTARGRAKVAIVMQRLGLSRTEAETLLEKHAGRIRDALRAGTAGFR